MHVEQRHHAQRYIVGRQIISSRDIPSRSRQVAMFDRHPLRPPRRSARMQHQRHTLWIHRRRRTRRSARDPAIPARIRLQHIHRHALRLRRRLAFAATTLRAVARKGRALDVAGVRDRDDDFFLRDQILNVDLKFPKYMSEEVKDFIKKLLEKRPEDRMKL